jgi:hypothetical protein
MQRRIILFLVALSAVYVGNAQLLDTSDVHRYKPVDVHFVNADDLLLLEDDSTALDTSLNLFYSYYPAYDTDFPFIDLGLEATPMLSLSSTQHRASELTLGPNPMQDYFFTDDIKIYKTQRPLTRLTYHQGANEMLNVGVIHAQQISERLSFGLDYRRIKNQNIYYSNLANLQTVRLGNLFNNSFYTSYYSPTRKYELVASYLWNKSTHAETGGIASDSLYSILQDRDKESNNAANYTNARNIIAQNKFTVTQYFRPGGKSTDSTVDQSLDQFTNQFYLTNSLNNRRVEFIDNSPDSANYGKILAAFSDSFYHRTILSEAGYMFRLKPFSLTAGIQHAYHKLYLNGTESSLNNVYVKAKTKLSYKGFAIEGNGKLGILGYNLGDYRLDAKAGIQIKDFDLSAAIISQLVEPNILEQNLYSSATFWVNDLKKISINSLNGKLGYKIGMHKVDLDAKLENTNGLIYYTAQGAEQLNNANVTVVQSKIRYSYQNRYMGSSAMALVQNSSNLSALPIPSVAGSANIFGKFRLFKKNLKVQVGARAFWFSDFNSPVYTPYTRAWHIDSDAGNFTYTPPINLYANGRVKSFCFGVEFFHTQQGLFGSDYFSSPGYPLMPRSLRLNMRWDLNN